MKPFIVKKIILPILLVLGSISLVFAWGSWGHQHINRAALFALPESMRVFFYNHADYITQESVMPDVRKHLYHDKAESARHYINLETYGAGGMDSLPLTREEALAKFGAAFLEKNGVLPWCIPALMDSLTRAFRQKRKADILFLAANLGHYIADAHMPLHTTVIHDGLQTGQHGIHGFWEGQLPELYGDQYNLFTCPAVYIADPVLETRKIIATTFPLADSLLVLDRNLKQGLAENEIYQEDSAGRPVRSFYGDPVHTRAYSALYHAALKGMIEKQMRAAIAETANYWYTAWVNAGKPDLNGLDPEELTQRNHAALVSDLQRWQAGKVTMVKADKEY